MIIRAKLHNEYAATLSRGAFADTPKAVFAAIAISSLTQGGDWLEEADARLFTEWNALHVAGIVPQPVPSKYRHFVTKHSQ